MAQEKNFETQVKEFLKTTGVYPLGTPKQKMTVRPVGYYEKRFANRNTKKGLPDMHIVIRGLSIEVELKARNGTPSELQIFNCNQIRESGGFAVILYPSAFETFKQFVNDLLIDKYTHDVPLIWK